MGLASACSRLIGFSLALLLAGVIAGCGESSSAEQSYGEVLVGLKRAAQHGQTYGAVSRAEGLTAANREIIASFCELARTIGLGSEEWKLSKHGYIERRIRVHAYERGEARLAPVDASLARLDSAIGFKTLTGASLRRYSKACNR